MGPGTRDSFLNRLFRSSSPEARRLSEHMRSSDDPLLKRRRAVAALSMLSMTAMGVVSLYQTGVLKHLPDLPGSMFDSDEVDASGEAYAYLQMPDAPPAAASFALTLALASVGGADRWRTLPLVPVGLAAKTWIDAIGGVWLTAEQAVLHRRFCSWCVISAAAALIAAPLAVREGRLASRQLRASIARPG